MLSDGNDWIKIFDRNFIAQPNSNKAGKHLPIPYFQIEEKLTTFNLAVKVTTQNAKPTWDLGARIYPAYIVINSELQRLRSQNYYTALLNQNTHIKIARASQEYQIVVDFPEWFKDARIEVWKFIGIEQLDTVEEKLENILLRLVRIGTKLDNLVLPSPSPTPISRNLQSSFNDPNKTIIIATM